MSEKVKFKQVGSYYYDVDSKLLGSGSFGKVYRGINCNNPNEPVAIKLISKAVFEKHKNYEETLRREIDILRKISSNNILELKGVIKTKSENIYMVSSLCNGGSLEGILKNKKTLTENESLQILRQTAQAFIDIAGVKGEDSQRTIIMHRDLKPANILFHDGNVRVADFGFAKAVQDEHKDKREKHSLLGTPLYMAPQILARKPYSYKCDVWSMGLVIYECLFGVLPWEFYSTKDYLSKVSSNPIPSFPKDTSIRSETQDLLLKMLKVREEERIDWEGILAHPSLTKNNQEEKILKCDEDTKKLPDLETKVPYKVEIEEAKHEKGLKKELEIKTDEKLQKINQNNLQREEELLKKLDDQKNQAQDELSPRKPQKQIIILKELSQSPTKTPKIKIVEEFYLTKQTQ